MVVPVEDKRKVIDTFVTAGIAFYLGGDWRGIFARSGIPHLVAWKRKEKEDMNQALEKFFTN